MNEELRDRVFQTLDKTKEVIYGQDNMIEAIIASLVCEGHLLIEGMPGLAKTLAVSTMSKLCSLAFKRIQFTPDLLPSDLIGTMIYNQSKEEFSTKFGPLFTQLLLADEINRAPAKVQSALLEAMAEKQVTIGNKSYKLTAPFVVLATQNPIDQEGTYRLPEAQMDRFMMKIIIDYPSFEAEKKILDLKIEKIDEFEPIFSTDDILSLQEEVLAIYVDDKIKDLIIRIVHATRPGTEHYLKEFDGAILAGASPRGAIWLSKLSRFKAYMNGKDYVTPDDVISVVPDVLGHRILLTYEALVDRIDSRTVAQQIARSVI